MPNAKASTAEQSDESSRRRPRKVLPAPESTVVSLEIPEELLGLTFAVQYNPNCPSRWLVRLPGSGMIDMKSYGNRSFGIPSETNDVLGFGRTFKEAAMAAISAPRPSAKTISEGRRARRTLAEC